MAVNAAAVRTGRRTRRFYVGMAIAIAITVFAGFSRSYFLKAWYGTPELSRLLHVHGLVFTTWVLFFLAQTTLVASGKTYLHRRMGIGGAALAAAERGDAGAGVGDRLATEHGEAGGVRL